MKTLVLLTTLALALPLAAQSTDTQGNGTRLRKRDGSANGTPVQQRLRDGSCGNPNPSGCRGAAQGARRGGNR